MRWVTVKEFAAEIGESESTVRGKCASGEWPSTKFGRRWKLDADKVYSKIYEEMELRMNKPLVVKDLPVDSVIKAHKQKLMESILCTTKCI